MGVFTVGRQVGLEILMPGWWLSGSSIDLDLRSGRYYDSSVPNTVPIITSYLSCSRASVGYAKDSSNTWVAFAANQLRLTDNGLLVENARTNNLLNSSAPATQTTASLATGDYTLWVEGSGSALASAGSATITGAASATENNPDTFTVSVAGTVTITVTGSLTKFQLELGAFPSSFILTTGVEATRAADNIVSAGSLTTILSASAGSVLADVITAPTSRPASDSSFIGEVSFTGKRMLGSATSDTSVQAYDLTTSLNPNLGGGKLFSTGVEAALGWDAVGFSVVGGGGTVSTTSASHGFGITSAQIGGPGVFVTGAFWTIRRLTAWNSRLADATLQSLTT